MPTDATKFVTAAQILKRRRQAKGKPRPSYEDQCRLTKRQSRSPEKESTVNRAERNRRRRLRKRAEVAQPLEDLLQHLQIEQNAWDYLLVGDGSGTVLDKECGFACVSIERETMTYTAHHGGASHGTNIMAEMLAYVLPLLYLTHNRLRRKSHGVRVHIVSDCQYLSTAWKHRKSLRKNKELWALFDVFTRRGIVLQFHWIPRDTWRLNQFCDTLAGRSRLALQPLQEASLAHQKVKTVYDLNPMTE